MSKAKSKSVVQQTMFDVQSVTQHKESTSKPVKTTTEIQSVYGLGINYGDFGEYIKKGRNNNLTWKK